MAHQVQWQRQWLCFLELFLSPSGDLGIGLVRDNYLAKYAYLGTYLGALNMVKWGVPEKILQNVVQTRWFFVDRIPQSEVMTKSHFCNPKALGLLLADGALTTG